MSTRAVDVNKLAEARIREILSIHDQVKGSSQDEYGIRGLPRGLRRRSRSHKRYRRGGRRPNVHKDKDSPGRLPTHVFHAKRMAMSRIDSWKFVVPEGTCGCGRGTRSFKHRLETGCIIHDASYWCSIELLGPMKEILPILSDLSNYTSPEYVGEERSSHQHADVPGGNGSCRTGPLEIVTCESSRVIIWAHCEYAAPVIRNVCEKVQKSDNISMKLGRLGRIEVRGPVSERIISKLGDEGRRGAPLTIENHNDPSLGDNCIWSMYDRINKKQVVYSASDLSNGLSDIVSGLVGYCVCSEPRGRECASSDDSITIAVIRNSSGFSIYLNRDIYKIVETFAARLDKNENFPSNLMRQSQTLFSRSERLSRVAIWIIKNGTLRQGDILCAIESPKILPSCGKMRIDSQRSLIRRGELTVAAKEDIHRWDVMGIVTSARPHGMNSKYPSIGLVASGSLPLMGKRRLICGLGSG
eukprot:jgi/Picre1/27856/NNA_000820.t1